MLNEALGLFAEHSVDCADALLAVRMRRRGIVEVVRLDAHLDRLPGVRRVEPASTRQTA